MVNSESFLERVRSGQASLDDVLDEVGRWHDSGGEGRELHDYLGMSWSEYALWVKHPGAITFIAEGSRAGIPLAEVVEQAVGLDDEGLARKYDVARSELMEIRASLDS